MRRPFLPTIFTALDTSLEASTRADEPPEQAYSGQQLHGNRRLGPMGPLPVSTKRLSANATDYGSPVPEWSSVYDRVNVTLTTHDVDGLSMKRAFDLARAMDAFRP